MDNSTKDFFKSLKYPAIIGSGILSVGGLVVAPAAKKEHAEAIELAMPKIKNHADRMADNFSNYRIIMPPQTVSGRSVDFKVYFNSVIDSKTMDDHGKIQNCKAVEVKYETWRPMREVPGSIGFTNSKPFNCKPA